jgi:hypothetical protein
MQNGCISNAGIQELRVGSKACYHLVDYLEQNIVAIRLMMQKKRVKFVRYGKDHMQIIDRQKIGFTFNEPSFTVNISALWTMAVPATVIDELFMAAMLAVFHPSSHGFGPAYLQCVKRTQMMTGQRVLPMQFRKEVLNYFCDLGPVGLHQDNGVG